MSPYNARWKAGPTTAFKYGIAVLSVTAALISAILMQTRLQTEPFASSFLCAIMFAAWFGGAGRDLLAAGLAVLAFIYFAAALTHIVRCGINGDTARCLVRGLDALRSVDKRSAEGCSERAPTRSR